MCCTSGPTNRVSSVPPETEVRAPCPVGRNEGVHTSVPLVRYEVFRDLRSLCPPPRGASTPRFSFRVARHAATDLQPMELAFLVAHRAHRRFASQQSTKVQADVRGTRAVAVHRQLASTFGNRRLPMPSFSRRLETGWSTGSASMTRCLTVHNIAGSLPKEHGTLRVTASDRVCTYMVENAMFLTHSM